MESSLWDVKVVKLPASKCKYPAREILPCVAAAHPNSKPSLPTCPFPGPRSLYLIVGVDEDAVEGKDTTAR